ncbi:MAG: hypothetical protein AAGJ82_03315, partial [Bacteroidota bacterium]
IPRQVVGSVNTAGGTLPVDGATITFPADAFAYPSGVPYTGAAEVYAAWLDPTAPNLGEMMPGGLYGIDENGLFVTMTTYGMVVVELEDTDGNELVLAEGKMATLQLTVPSELLTHAPNEIPLWFFDETSGLWIAEGAASLENGSYVGEVSHFTYWNVDYPYQVPTVNITGCLEYNNGAPAANVPFHVTFAGDTSVIIVRGGTDSDGNFGGPVPTGDLLAINVYNTCGSVTSIQVGPFNEDTDLNDCLVIPDVPAYTYSGQLLDCDGLPVVDGIVSVAYGGYAQQILTDAAGNFNTSLPACTASFDADVLGIDYANELTSTPQTVTFSGDQTNATLTACNNQLAEFLISTANGEEYVFVTPTLFFDSLPTPGWTITDQLQTTEEIRNFNLRIPLLDVGTYTGNGVNYFYVFSNFVTNGENYLSCSDPCADITVNITANGGSGGYLEGNYSGTADGGLMNSQVYDIPVSGSFRVLIP